MSKKKVINQLDAIIKSEYIKQPENIFLLENAFEFSIIKILNMLKMKQN